MPYNPLTSLRTASVTEREKVYRDHTRQRLQLTALEMGVTAVAASTVALLARLLTPSPEYVGLRVLLLPLTALFAFLITRAPSVRSYGLACMATIATVGWSSYLGALGTDRPLMYFLPAAILLVTTSSFFWITMAQWVAGSLTCYAFFLPFAINHTADRADTIWTLMFAGTALAAGFVTHLRIQDYQRRAFDQECRLAELSATDALTGASSRAQFLEQAEQAAAHARLTGARLALLYLDIDHFKRLNDAHGHAAGDAVLRGMADALRQALRDGDVFGRLGGEEFCVLLPGQGEDEALALAQRLRQQLIRVPRPDERLTVSGGIAALRPGEAVTQTLHRADLAMLKAKQSGRDQVYVAD